MADADTSQSNNTEKAEKLAAARKRFEELKRKKQPNKKASSATPQKEAASNDTTVLEASSYEISGPAESIKDDGGQPEVDHTGTPRASGTDETAIKDEGAEKQLDGSYLENEPPESHSANSDVLLETLPEIYRKQASVIDDLRTERQHLLDEIKALNMRAQEGSKAMVERDKALEDLASVSQELQTVKEKNGMEQATLLEGAGEASALKIEVASLNRQIAHLQSQIAQKDKAIVGMRRDSSLGSPGPEEVVKQEERIESMSVELSESKAALEASLSSVNTLKSERDHLETLVGSTKIELQAATKRADDLDNKLARLAESIHSDSAKNSAWEEKTRLQEQTITGLKQTLAGMKSTVDQLEVSNQGLRASERDSEVRYRDIERRLANAQRENSSMQMRLAELKSSLHRSFTQPTNMETPETLHQGGGDGNEVRPNQPQEDAGSERSSAGNHLWRQVLADENSQDFLDVDLRAVTRKSMQSQPIPERPHVPSQGDHERRSLTQRVRKELESWRGHRINLIDVYHAYDDSYSRVFDI
ncbi:hypothetical protein TWF281_004928 [Arthrobotrys megalospora]